MFSMPGGVTVARGSLEPVDLGPNPSPAAVRLVPTNRDSLTAIADKLHKYLYMFIFQSRTS